MNRIRLNLEQNRSSSYDILIGHDILERICWMIKKEFPAGRYVIVTDSRVRLLYGDLFWKMLRKLDLPTEIIDFPAGEAHKNMTVALEIVDRLLMMGADRQTTLLAMGGGVVGDLAGFVASIYLRSVPYVHIPTTLIAQIDSSIGGKTGVDHARGKNLVGTFYQPQGVFIDTKFLATLPDTEWLNGIAEIVKYALIEGGPYLELLEANISALKERQAGAIGPIVEGACRIKKGFVEIDEFDRGVRRFLNLGHTTGHALEAESGYELAHGEAVALGIRAALAISARLFGLPREDVRRALDLMDSLALPAKMKRKPDLTQVLAYLRKDKKRVGETINLILLKRIGMPFVSGNVNEETLREILGDLLEPGNDCPG